MTGLLRSEYLKLRTTNVWWGILIGVVVFTALALLVNWAQTHSLLNDGSTGDDTQDALANSPAGLAANVYTSGQFLGLMLAMILGALIVTNEFFHQTATPTFLTTPKRSAVIVAKLITAAIWGVICFVVTAIFALPFGALILSHEGSALSLGDSAIWTALGTNALAFAIWSIFGLGLGTLLRNQIWTVVLVAVIYLIGQNAVLLVLALLADWLNHDWISDISYWLPEGASRVMVSTTDLPGTPPWWAGALTLLAYGAVAAALGTLLTTKRDIA